MRRAVADITVVIPVYNRADIVERTLNSISQQTMLPARLIIVDNNSTDKSLIAIERWISSNPIPEMAIDLISEQSPGAAAARNSGLRLASTEWTMFFDSDDIMLPGHIERAAKAIKDNRDADLIGWDVLVRYPEKSVVLRFEEKDLEWHSLMHGSMATLRYMARTSLFREAGGWDETLSTWDDIEFGSRILTRKPKVVKSEGKSTVEVTYSMESITGTSYSSRLKESLTALERIRESYPRLSHVNLKESILLGDCRNEGCREAYRLYKALKSRQSRHIDKLICSFGYVCRRLRIRGVARIYRIISSLFPLY